MSEENEVIVQNASDVVVKEETPVAVSVESEETGPWRVFAIIGFVVGIISLVFFWCPFECFYISPFGIIFGALGKNSKAQGGKGRLGLIMSVISAIVNLLFSILAIVGLISLGL